MTARAPAGLLPLVIALCALAGLSACTSSVPINYYRLDPMELDDRPAEEARVIVAVGPVVLPDYLQRPQQVRRGRGAEMQLDERNYWVEPLDDAVPRIVAANVDRLAEGIAVVASGRGVVRADYRLFATVHRFDTDAAGNAELVVQWGLTGAERAAVVAPRTSRYHAVAAPVDQPGAMAVAMSDLLAQFSREVAEALPRAVAAGRAGSTRPSL